MADGDTGVRRLFFALWPDEATRAALDKASHHAVRASGGRRVPPANYHVTLAFLGTQPAALFADVVGAAAGIDAEPLAFDLERFGYWPKPRVLWMGPEKTPTALARLAGKLWDRMEQLGLRRENRPLQAHVTLARKVAALPEVPAPDPLKWSASSFALVESQTDQRGALYTVVREFRLGSLGEPNHD